MFICDQLTLVVVRSYSSIDLILYRESGMEVEGEGVRNVAHMAGPTYPLGACNSHMQSHVPAPCILHAFLMHASSGVMRLRHVRLTIHGYLHRIVCPVFAHALIHDHE